MQLRNKKLLLNMTRANNQKKTNPTSSNEDVDQVTVEDDVSSPGNVRTSQAVPTSNTVTQTSSQAMPSMATVISQAMPSMVTQTSHDYPNNTSIQGVWDHRSMPYGMPSSLMQGLQTSGNMFSENLNVSLPQLFGPGVSTTYRSPQQNLTNASMAAIRQTMEETNHDMVNMMTQQIGTVINPLIRDTNTSYQRLSDQMERIANFFGAPPIQNNPLPQNRNLRAIEIIADEPVVRNHENIVQPQVVQPQVQAEPERQPILVNRNQDADQVVLQARRNNFDGQNNIAGIVEALLAQNGFNMGLHRPNFVSPLSEYVLDAELPRNWKIPKFTKFAGETNESTVEHIARFLMEAGNIAENENLRMKYFPSSLTKNAFTWFTTLPPHSIYSWNQLEKAFHEQFYMGQSKISLKELASVRRKSHESIDDYLNRFRLLKARCFTSVPEYELVEMAAGGLDYSVRKKLDTQYLRDMAQLADRVRQVERLKAEKTRTHNKFPKKEKIAYIETGDSEPEFDWGLDIVEDNDINLAELKDGPPYACKMLRPSNGKNPEDPKSDKYPSKTYTFDITKSEEIFDLLVNDGIILVPPNMKLPPLEQRKKRGFCKFHGFLGHNLSRCTRFRDSVQKALDEGRLKFGEKSKQQVDGDPMKKAESMFADVSANVVESMFAGISINMVEISDNIDVEMVTEDHQIEEPVVTEDQLAKEMEKAYPKAEEDLVDFLNRCKISNTNAMLCPRCSAVFDKEAAKSVEGYQPQTKRKGGWFENRSKFGFNKRGVPYKMKTSEKYQVKNHKKTFVPSSKSPIDTWVFSGGKKTGHSAPPAPPTKWVKRAVKVPDQPESSNPNKYAYKNNYKGKNPMTRTQWRRFQRQKKEGVLKDVTNGDKSKGKQPIVFEMVKKPATERIFPPLSSALNIPKGDDDILTSTFSDSEPSLDIICVVSVLPIEYAHDVSSKANHDDECDFTEEMARHRPLCYYVMNNGCIEDQHAVFEKPDDSMKLHLKPLFIQAKLNGVGINKVLVDGGATVNLLPQSFLRKLGISECDLKPHNVVLTNYEGSTGQSLGAIELELVVGSITRATVFLVVPSKANFNALLGREWIHAVGAVPSTMHQRIVIWRKDGLVENIEADQSYYFKAEVDNQDINKKNFDKQLQFIAPFMENDASSSMTKEEKFFVKLAPEWGFRWKTAFDDDFVVVNNEDCHEKIPVKEKDLLKTRSTSYKRVTDDQGCSANGISPTRWDINK